MEQKGFSQDWLDKLKFNNDIVSVISKYLPLKKNGKTFWGCCPFHHEKTPSFAINSSEQYYHCFGCGVGGNVITFIQKIEGVDFIEAVKILAKNANMELPEFTEDKRVVEKRKRIELLEQICTDTAKYYNKILNSTVGQKAQKYLQSRGVTQSTITRVGLGYSSDWNGLINHLHKLGYTNKQMVEAGVAGEKNGRVYDFMAERLVFPVINTRNKVVGFSGRALEDKGFAKYKNTAQTEIFNKSTVIFGLHTLRKARLDKNVAILVEGQMDVVTLYQAGFENAVATMGTAFNSNHVKTLSRFVDDVIICFDGDTAGKKATERSLEPLLQDGINIKVLSLPDKLDPDEYIKKYGQEKFKILLDSASEVYEFEISNLSTKYNIKDKKQLAQFVNEALKIIASIKNEVEQTAYLNYLIDITGLGEELLKRELRKILYKEVKPSENGKQLTNTTQTEVVVKNKIYYAEQFVLSAVINKQTFAENYILKEENFSISIYNSIVKFMINNNTKSISSLIDHFNDNQEFSQLVSFNFDSVKNKEKYFQECCKTIEINKLNNRVEILKKALATEESQEGKNKIIVEISNITKEIQIKKTEG